jgi:HAE1 family hydrophobic/amphiphilic exporter-1
LRLIPVQENPNTNYPILTVSTIFPGADAELIDRTITKPLENILNTVSGINIINSYSETNKSSIQISFKYNTNMQQAYEQVQTKVESIRDKLPQDAHYPEIATVNSNDAPIVLLSLTGKQHISVLNNYAREQILPILENLPGVGKINIFGDSNQTVHIDINPAELATYKLTLNDIQRAFYNEHVNVAGGDFAIGSKRHALNLNLEYHHIKDLGKLIVSVKGGAPVYLSDVATVKYASDNKLSQAYYDGKEAIGISIIKKSGSNTLNLLKEINAKIANLEAKSLPNGMQINTVYSQANTIWNTIDTLIKAIITSFITASLVILLFLTSIRSTSIILAAMLAGVISVIFYMYLFKQSINIITLLGLVVLIGIIIDDSIVVTEDLFTKIENKTENLLDAVAQSLTRITSSIFACSLTLLCIFVPTLFISGSVGLLMKPFGVVLSIGIIISFLLVLTFVPLLALKIYQNVGEDAFSKSKFSKHLAVYQVRLKQFYQSTLSVVLNKPWYCIIAMIVLLISAIPIYYALHKTYMPPNYDTGYFTVNIQSPVAMNISYTEKRVKAAEAVLKDPEIKSHIENYFVSSGPTPNQGSISIMLKNTNSSIQKHLMTVVQNKLNRIPGAEYFVQLPSQGDVVSFEIRGNNYHRLVSLGNQLSDDLRKIDSFKSVYIVYTPDEPQYKVVINRVLANNLGITTRDVADALMATGTSGLKIGKFTDTYSNRYDVILKINKQHFDSVSDLYDLYLRGSNKKLVSLKTILNLKEELLPAKLTRSDLSYSMAFNVKSKVSTNETLSLINKTANKVLPRGYQITLLGQAAQLSKIQTQLVVIILFVFLLLYVVLASQFNSYLQPLIIMIMQPNAIAGGLFTLWVTGQSLNIYSIIGLLLLVGLVAKSSILIVSFTNRLIAKGSSVHVALQQVCPERLRPILMTALAILATMLPTAIWGSATYKSLATVIAGGICFSAVLSLIIVPAFYILIEKLPHRILTIEQNANKDIETYIKDIEGAIHKIESEKRH